MVTKEQIMGALSHVMDPELNRDLVSLGMIDDVLVDESGNVSFTINLTTPACPLKSKIETEAKQAVKSIDGVSDVNIRMGAKVPKDKSLEEKVDLDIKNIIAVSSGKGGVGKTTVSVNLAMALRNTGAKVGILDADIYGPNVPTMIGVKQMPPPRDNKLIPADAFGVKVVSIGFLVKDGQPLIWRGPLLHSTIRQFLVDVNWGELDYLIVDLPPGTGDVQLSLSQHIPVTCGVVVTMPQKVSLDDASRGIEMLNKLNIPIAGLIENMGVLELPDGTLIEVFGNGGGEQLANVYGVPFLGRIPLEPEIRKSGDAGTPIVISSPDSKTAKLFSEIACNVASFTAQIVMNK